MIFDKMHGLGNDFVFIKKSDLKKNPTAEDYRFLCNRKIGIGCDTVIVYDENFSETEGSSGNKIPKVEAEFFNADGSCAEICLNASRCLGLLLNRKLRLSEFVLKSHGKIYKIHVNGAVISINLPAPSFSHEDIGITEKTVDVLNMLPFLELSKDEIAHFFAACVISVGNPHLVLFIKNDEISAQVDNLGERLEKFHLFKNRINVSFAKVIGRNKIELKVFERGVGFTSACGSGACATAYCACELGLTEKKIQIDQFGGSLEVEISRDSTMIQRGTAEYVFHGEINL